MLACVDASVSLLLLSVCIARRDRSACALSPHFDAVGRHPMAEYLFIFPFSRRKEKNREKEGEKATRLRNIASSVNTIRRCANAVGGFSMPLCVHEQFMETHFIYPFFFPIHATTNETRGALVAGASLVGNGKLATEAFRNLG